MGGKVLYRANHTYLWGTETVSTIQRFTFFKAMNKQQAKDTRSVILSFEWAIRAISFRCRWYIFAYFFRRISLLFNRFLLSSGVRKPQRQNKYLSERV